MAATPLEVLSFAVTFDDIPALPLTSDGIISDVSGGGGGGGMRNGGLGSIHGRLHLEPTDFRWPLSDGLILTKIVGTAEGRIIAAGRDSALHELLYEPPIPSISPSSAAGGTAAGGGGGITGAVASATGAVARFVIEGAAGVVSRGLGISALLPAAKRARRIDHGGPGVLATALKSLTGNLFASQTYPLIDVAVDHHRRLLYTLASNGEIRLYGLGPSPVSIACGSGGGGGGHSSAASAATSGSGVLPPSTALPLLAVIRDPEAACRAYAVDPRSSSLNKPRPDVFKPDLPERVLRGGGGPHTGGAPAAGSNAPAVGAGAGQTGIAWPLVSLHVIPPTQSSRVHLVALAQSGARLYFSTLNQYRYAATAAVGSGAALQQQQQQQQQLAAGGGGHYSPSMDTRPVLTLVYVRMPPPAVTSDQYTGGGSAGSGVDYGWYNPDGFAPTEDAPSLQQAHDAFVSGDLALIPTTLSQSPSSSSSSSSLGASGVVGSSSSVGREHVIALVHDPLQHALFRASAAGGGGAGAVGLGFNGARFNESVQDIVLDGTVHGIAEVDHPRAPSINGVDAIYTECGALQLPEGETAPLPCLRLTEICAGTGALVPDASAYTGSGISSGAGLTSPLAGTKRGYDAMASSSSSDVSAGGGLRSFFGFSSGPGSAFGATAASNVTTAGPGQAQAEADAAGRLLQAHLPSLQSALCLQHSLLDSGVPSRFHHLVRRRLWGEQPGAGGDVIATPYSGQHDVSASFKGYVILTTFGVYRLARVRPIDQFSRLLKGLPPSSSSTSAAAASTLARTPARATAAAASSGLGRSGVFSATGSGAGLYGGGGGRDGPMGSPAAAASLAATGGLASGASSSPAIATLYRWIVGDEVCAMAVALACGLPVGDVWAQAQALLGRAPFSPVKGGTSSRAGESGFATPGASLRSHQQMRSPLSPAAAGGSAAATAASSAAVAKAAATLFEQRGGLPGWRPTAIEYRLEDLVFSGRLNGLLLTSARLLRPLWGASLFITPPLHLPPGRLQQQYQQNQQQHGGMMNTLSRVIGGYQAQAPARAACLLPRWTAGELRPLARQLQALSSFLASHFSFSGWGDEQLAALAKDTGMAGRLGLHTLAQQLQLTSGAGGNPQLSEPDAYMLPQTAEEKKKRANALEMIYVILLSRLLKRAAEGVSLLAAVSDPANGALPILASLAAGRPTQAVVSSPPSASAASVLDTPSASPVSDDALWSLCGGAGRLTFAQLVTSADGNALAEGLTTRMLQALRSLPPTIASTGGGSGRAGGDGVGLSSLPGYQSPQQQQQQQQRGGLPLADGTASSGVAALVGDGASSLSSYLRSSCPSFFSEAHHALLVAERQADGAAAASSTADRLRLLHSSLREAGRAVTEGDAEGIASSLPRITALCAVYRSLGFYSGVIGLALAGGDRLARLSGAPLSAIPSDALPLLDGQPASLDDQLQLQQADGTATTSGAGTAALRLQLYGLITDMLASVRNGSIGSDVSGGLAADADAAAAGNTLTMGPSLPSSASSLFLGGNTAFRSLLGSPQAPSNNNRAGGQQLSATSLLTGNNTTAAGAFAGASGLPPSESAFRSLLSEVLRSGDALFHHSLYAWMADVSQGPAAADVTAVGTLGATGQQLLTSASAAACSSAPLLARLSTPFIEGWLTGSFDVAVPVPALHQTLAVTTTVQPHASPSGPPRPDLLFTWLLCAGRHKEAALLQRTLAEREGPGYAEPLATRIERLTLAIALGREPAVRLQQQQHQQQQQLGATSLLSSTSKRGLGATMTTSTSVAPLLPLSQVADWEASLEVMRLQAEVKAALTSAADVLADVSSGAAADGTDVSEAVASAIGELEYGRPSLQDLYRCYASRFGLHECCLAILALTSQPEHAPLVAEHWKAIVAQRLQAVSQQSGGESGPAAAIATLKATLGDLGQRLVTSSPSASSSTSDISVGGLNFFAFPVGFLAGLIESHAAGDGWEEALEGQGQGYPHGEPSVSVCFIFYFLVSHL